MLTVTKHRRSRFRALRDAAGDLICLSVYKHGALEVGRRPALADSLDPWLPAVTPPDWANNAVRQRASGRRPH